MKNGEELKVGDAAPAFEAIAVGREYGEGQNVTVRDFRGWPVVLYFYPKDDTPSIQGSATESLSINMICHSRFSPIPKRRS